MLKIEKLWKQEEAAFKQLRANEGLTSDEKERATRFFTPCTLCVIKGYQSR